MPAVKSVLTTEKRYYAVVVPATGRPALLRTDSPEELAKLLRPYYGKDVQVFPFYGVAWGINKGPYSKYLLGPGGEVFPISPPNEMEIDQDGSLCVDVGLLSAEKD